LQGNIIKTQLGICKFILLVILLSIIILYKRGGGDPAPPCVTEAENGKNARSSHWRWDTRQILVLLRNTVRKRHLAHRE
jgi:hypothetical protein